MKNIKIKNKLFITTIALLFSGSLYAKDSSNNSNSMFDFDIFSLTKKKESAFDASSSVYVLSSEDIRRSGVTSIPEALRLVPGVQVARVSGNSWAVSARGLNHQFASKLLVLMDGMTIYSPSLAGVVWDNHDYVMEDIDRIEVIRGPGGSIWGANAMNGIINIITKNSAETQGGYISQISGNHDKSITEVRYGGKTSAKNTYRVYAKHAVRDGFDKMNDGKVNIDTTLNTTTGGSNNDGMVNDRAGFRYDISSMKDNTLSLHADIFNNKSRNYFQGFSTNADKVNTGGDLTVNWNKKISKKSDISLQTYYFYDRNDLQVVDFRERTFDIDFQHFYNFSRNNQFIWGLGYRNLQDKIGTNEVNGSTGAYVPIEYFPSKRNIETYSAFIRDKIGIVSDKLFLTLGTKFEHNDQTGTEYQPNARLTYYPARNQTLWAAVSRAIRTPTRGEDGIEIKSDVPGLGVATVTRGNQAALAETVNSYELGYRIKPTESTLIDISTYINQYSRLGNFDADGAVLGTPTASNTGRAKTFGGELTGKWQATSALRFEIGYDFLKSDIKLNAASNETDVNASVLNADRLPYFENMSPSNQFRLRAFYNVTPKIEFDNTIYYVDYLEGRNDGAGTIEEDVPSYVRWDTRLGYLATRNLDLSFGIQNILDDKHNEYGPGLFNNRIEVGRTFYVKAALQF